MQTIGERIPHTQHAALQIDEATRERLVLEAKVKGYLQDAPALAAHIRTLVVSDRATRHDTPKVDTSENALLPFNSAAFDDLNGMYAELTNWATMWARVIQAAPPASVLGFYRNDEDCRGLPSWATASDARTLTRDVARWLLTGFDLILQEPSADDYLAELERLFKPLFSSYPMRPRRKSTGKATRPCPRCGERALTVEFDAKSVDPETGGIITLPALVACRTCFYQVENVEAFL